MGGSHVLGRKRACREGLVNLKEMLSILLLLFTLAGLAMTPRVVGMVSHTTVSCLVDLHHLLLVGRQPLHVMIKRLLQRLALLFLVKRRK